ncbi:HAD family hydrolase [Limobrevibacterium gyesilva]|uniref:phosphoglycolate phosphatase n=1 Tax=Limobrevibacterium gyesilva TaxID=2991712 RepID=A0AA41YQS3_9PROT|nr:HAD family hydrolase [Limobrevibacterium gyesilva]MCW3473802.1 HAD family hydrolase [Limobrevibacterium gyesilva]
MQRPQAILWDWDNTLVDGWAGITAALNVVFAAHAMPAWTVADALARVRGSLRDTFPGLFGESWREAVNLFRTTMAERHLQYLRVMPGIGELLQAADAWPLAVVSNKDGPLLRREVAHLGWNAAFRAVVGAGDAAADKPDPAPIWYALAEMGLQPGRNIWYVGDTAIDMRAARAAGCTAVLLGDAAHDGGIAALEEDGAGPHLHCSDASSLTARFRAFAAA